VKRECLWLSSLRVIVLLRVTREREGERDNRVCVCEERVCVVVLTVWLSSLRVVVLLRVMKERERERECVCEERVCGCPHRGSSFC